MNPYDPVMLTYISYVKYEDGHKLESKTLKDLTPEEDEALVNYLFSKNVCNKDWPDKILKERGYFSLESVKEQKNISISNKDKIYCPHQHYSWEEIAVEEKLSDYRLSKFGSGFFVKVQPPKEIQDQINAYHERLAQKKIQNEEKKKARKIKKAEKLLKEAGKL